MADDPTVLVRHVRRLAGAERLADRDLLDRFARLGDEAAFEAVLRRYGPLVLGVGRRVLGNRHDAEEVFQATFLTLARKASSVAWRESVGPWLGETARRLALEARARSARRREREANALRSAHDDPLADVSLREAQAIVEEELGRLPSRCRAPLLLCCLEGWSRDEASQQLGLPLGTLKRRLEEGRELLRTRLERRGLTLSGAMVAVELGRESVPPELLIATAMAASGKAALAGACASFGKGPAVAALLAAAALAGVVAMSPMAAPPPAVAPPRPAPDLPPGAVARLGDVGLRHGARICASVLSPDGRRLATSSGRSVAIWDIKGRRRIHLFSCDRGPHYSTPKLAFSPDGHRLGYVHCDDFACIWDLGTGKELCRFEKAKAGYIDCKFTPDGREVVLVEQGWLRYRDPVTGSVKRSFAWSSPSRLSPDAERFVHQGVKTVLVGDARTGKVAHLFQIDAVVDGVENGIAFSPDGKKLALVERHSAVRVYEVSGGKLLASFPVLDAVRFTLKRMGNWKYQVGFSTDGNTVLLASTSGLVNRWDLATGKELTALKPPFGRPINAHIPAGGRTVITTGDDGMIRLWDAATGRELVEPSSYVGRVCAAMSHNGGLVAVGDAAGRIDIWRAAEGRRLRTILHHGPAVRQLAFSSDGKSLAAARDGGRLNVWDVATGRETIELLPEQPKPDHARAILFSPDGRFVCLVGSRRRLRVYEVATGKEKWSGAYGWANYSPDGTVLAAVEERPDPNDNVLTDLVFLDPATGKPAGRAPLPGRADARELGACRVSCSPDGRLLAASLPGGTVCLLDARSGAEVRRFQAAFPSRWDKFRNWREPPEVPRLDELNFSPDGRWLVTCGSDEVVRLWEVDTGEKVHEWVAHEGAASYVGFGPDGRSVLSAGDDGQVYLWSLRPPPGPRATLEALWERLRSGKAEDAYRAVWALSETPGAAAFLRRKITPVEPLPKGRLEKLIADLGSDRFAPREAATKELETLGERAAPMMRKALDAGPEPEARRRIGRLLDAAKRGPSPEGLRQSRAIQAVALAATPEARDTLKAWAAGAADARLTTEAAAALRRLTSR